MTASSEPPEDERGPFARRLVAAGGAPVRYARVIQASRRMPLLQVVKTAVAATLAWVACLLILPGQIPVFGAVAAIIVVQPSVNQTFAKAIERSFGVIVGVAIAYFAGVVFGNPSWLVLAAILISLLTAWALKLGPGGTVQVPISAMLVLSIGAQTPGYALDRILETFIGAIIAVLVNLAIVPPVSLQPARDAIAALGREVAASIDGLGTLLERPSTGAERTGALIEVRLLGPMLSKARTEILSAEESLRFNPRGSAHRESLGRENEILAMLSVLANRVPGMVRALDDHYDESLTTEPTAGGLATELSRAAHDLRLLLGLPEPTATPGEPVRGYDEGPALTQPFVVLAPSARHWVLIGSLIEDLRRVHEVIVLAGRGSTGAK